MIDEKKSKDKIVSRQTIQQSLLHTLQQSIQDKLLENKISKEEANSTVKFTVDKIVNKTAKNFKINYRQAKERRRADDLQFRLDRILRIMRPRFSSDRYMDILRSIGEASYYEKLDFIAKMERMYDEHRTVARPVSRSS